MRDVGQQLPARPVGFDQLRLAGGQVGGHSIEGGGHGRHFVAANRRRAGRQVAFAKPPGRIFERAQARLGRPKDHQRRERRAGYQQQERTNRQRGADLVGDTAQAGQRRYPDHADYITVVFDRRHDRAAPRSAERHSRHRAWGWAFHAWAAVRRSLSGLPRSPPGPPRRLNGPGMRMPPGTSTPGGATTPAIGEDDHGRPMKLADSPAGVGFEVKRRIARQRRFELRCHEFGEIAAHALGHAAFGFPSHPDEEPDLQAEGDGQEQDQPRPMRQ